MMDGKCLWCGDSERVGYLKACGPEHFELIWGIEIYSFINNQSGEGGFMERDAFMKVWRQRSRENRAKLAKHPSAVKVLVA